MNVLKKKKDKKKSSEFDYSIASSYYPSRDRIVQSNNCYPSRDRIVQSNDCYPSRDRIVRSNECYPFCDRIVKSNARYPSRDLVRRSNIYDGLSNESYLLSDRLSNNINAIRDFDDLDENDIKKQFVDADSVKPNPEPQKHPNYIYTSKHINTTKIIIGSKKISTEIPN
ncbi:21273_t:CDS:2, partial [Gigaspora margarita]